jgi:hypothetical protein
MEGGVTPLGGRTTWGRCKKWRGNNEVEGVGSSQEVTWRLEGVKLSREGATLKYTTFVSSRKNVNPPRGA